MRRNALLCTWLQRRVTLPLSLPYCKTTQISTLLTWKEITPFTLLFGTYKLIKTVLEPTFVTLGRVT